MRHNICIILNAKSKKDAYKEIHETVDLYREDEHMNTEYESYITKSMLEEEYEDFKQQYRDKKADIIKKRLDHYGFNDIEDYIAYALDLYGWNTLEKYALNRYNIIRFEGDKCIGLYNPRGYIDGFDGILAFNKYKKLTAKKLKNCAIAEVILPDKTDITWDMKKDYKTNKLILKQAINKYATKDTYIAIVRVHF